MTRCQRAGVLVRSWRGPWRAAGLTLLSSCAAGGVPGLNRSACSAVPDSSQMPQQRNSGQLQPPHKPVVTDPLTACLDANGTYICTAYHPRCYIIQKVRLGVEDKLPYVTRTLLFAVCSEQCHCLTSLCGLLPASFEVHLSLACGVRSQYTQNSPPPLYYFVGPFAPSWIDTNLNPAARARRHNEHVGWERPCHMVATIIAHNTKSCLPHLIAVHVPLISSNNCNFIDQSHVVKYIPVYVWPYKIALQQCKQFRNLFLDLSLSGKHFFCPRVCSSCIATSRMMWFILDVHICKGVRR